MPDGIDQLGTKLAEALAPKRRELVTVSYGTVKAVNETEADVRIDVDLHGGTLYGLPMTTACKGVAVGDRVIVQTYGHLSTVTGVIAHDNSHYVTGKVFIGSTILRSSAQGGQILFSSPGNFVENFGRKFDYTRDFVIMYNGDGNAIQYCTIAPEVRWKNDVQEIVARTSRSIGEGQMFRVNWLVYLGE